MPSSPLPSQYLESTQAPGIFLFALHTPLCLLSPAVLGTFGHPLVSAHFPGGMVTWAPVSSRTIKVSHFLPPSAPSRLVFSFQQLRSGGRTKEVLSVGGENGSVPASSACVNFWFWSAAQLLPKKTCIYGLLRVVFPHRWQHFFLLWELLVLAATASFSSASAGGHTALLSCSVFLPQPKASEQHPRHCLGGLF